MSCSSMGGRGYHAGPSRRAKAMHFRNLFVAVAIWICTCGLLAQPVTGAGADALQVVQDGRPLATVYLSSSAGELEKAAAADLVKYVEMMSGARLPLMIVPEGALAPLGPALLVGKVALAEDAG